MKLFYSVPLSRLKAVFVASVKMTLILPDKCCPQLWDLNDYFPFLMKRGSCAKKQVGQKWGLSVVQISPIYCQEILSYFEFKAFDSAVLSLTGYFEGKGIHTKGKPLFRCLLDWLTFLIGLGKWVCIFCICACCQNVWGKMWWFYQPP